MDGFILVDKPEGISSFGVVAKIRRIISQAEGKKVKAGHCGTLDPLAGGLMILVIGKYTKKAQQFSSLNKTYEAEITFGFESSTGDRGGDLTKISNKIPSREAVLEVLNKFMGTSLQTPPAFSAVKINGQRAYKLARAGKKPQLQTRQVEVHSIQITDYSYPKLSVVTEVSSGTYIRSLAEDIGRQLGVGGYLSKLRRIKVGNHTINQAISLETADWQKLAANLQQGL